MTEHAEAVWEDYSTRPPTLRHTGECVSDDLPWPCPESLPGRTRAWLDNGKRPVIDGDPLPPGRHLTIYRGQPSADPIGIEWTLRREVAERAGGVVLTSRVHRRLVMAYLTGNDEAEVIIDPAALWRIEEEAR